MDDSNLIKRSATFREWMKMNDLLKESSVNRPVVISMMNNFEESAFNMLVFIIMLYGWYGISSIEANSWIFFRFGKSGLSWSGIYMVMDMHRKDFTEDQFKMLHYLLFVFAGLGQSSYKNCYSLKELEQWMSDNI